jgi:hypothetical protein
MNKERAFLHCRALALLVFLALGCKADPFTDVSGTVTLDGNPIAEGEIIFEAGDHSATPSAGKIVDGRFKFRATYGAKKVQINATKDTGRKEKDGWPIFQSIIPERYNTKSELTADIKTSGPNEFTFTLVTKK